MKIDQQLKSKYGTERPFVVPTNYFESLSSRIVEQINDDEQHVDSILDEKQKHSSTVQLTTLNRLRPMAIAAVSIGIIVIAFLSFSLYSARVNATRQPTTTADKGIEQREELNDNFDAAANYLMIDEDDMYAYMSSE